MPFWPHGLRAASDKGTWGPNSPPRFLPQPPLNFLLKPDKGAATSGDPALCVLVFMWLRVCVMRRFLRFGMRAIVAPMVVILTLVGSAARAQQSPQANQSQIASSQNAQATFAQSATTGQSRNVWDGRWDAPLNTPIPNPPMPSDPISGQPIPSQPIPGPQPGLVAPGYVIPGAPAQAGVQTFAMAGGGAMMSVMILSMPVVTTTTTEYVTETYVRSAQRSRRRMAQKRACTCRLVCQ